MKMRKKRANTGLTGFEMEMYCYGYTLIDEILPDEQKVKDAWPLHKDKIMQWWFGDDDIPSFSPDFEQMPKSQRIGNRPRFWWIERGLKL